MRPIELWSIITTSSTMSAPFRRSKAPGISLGRPSALSMALCSTSSMSVDLPEPDTPVIHTRRRSGNSTSMFLRLCSRTAVSLMARFAGTITARSSLLTGFGAGARGATCFAPDRYCPVSERGLARTASGVSKATISPPRSPAPGPRSSSRSAASMICGSCSTTTSELPASRRRCMTCVTRCMSRGCSPMDGSSSTNSVFTSDVPSAVVRLMRWTSPPESVRDWRSSVR